MPFIKKPEERIYGKNKKMYGMTERGNRIELHVYTGNKGMRGRLGPPSPKGNDLLHHLEKWTSKPNSQAEYWLAQVMRDYQGHFRDDRVIIILEKPEGTT